MIAKAQVRRFEKEHALRHILTTPPKMLRAQDSERERRIRIATVPVHLKIEHCTYERSSKDGCRIGQAKRSVINEMFVQTLHAPLQGFEGTIYEQVRDRMKEIYELEFAAAHRGHVHPSQEDGEVIMGELRLVEFPGYPEKIFLKNGWQEALMTLTQTQRYYPLLDQDVQKKHKTATFVMSFTCPRVG